MSSHGSQGQELGPCAHCGWDALGALENVLYPTGKHFMLLDAGKPNQAYHLQNVPGHPSLAQWEAHCLETRGGCGAKVWGRGREGAIAAWNRTHGVSASPDGQCLRDGVAESSNKERNGNADWTKAGTGVDSPTSPGSISRKATTGSAGSNPAAVAPPTEAEYLAMRSARHDWPACAIFRGGRCTCDTADDVTACGEPSSPTVEKAMARFWRKRMELLLSDYRHALLGRDSKKAGEAYDALLALAPGVEGRKS